MAIPIPASYAKQKPNPESAAVIRYGQKRSQGLILGGRSGGSITFARIGGSYGFSENWVICLKPF